MFSEVKILCLLANDLLPRYMGIESQRNGERIGDMLPTYSGLSANTTGIYTCSYLQQKQCSRSLGRDLVHLLRVL